MATKYTKTTIEESAPNWEASGAEPPDSMKSQGFLSGYKPPAAYFNWFWTKVSVLFSQILTVVNNMQNYLNNKLFYIRYDVGEMTAVGNLVSYMQQGRAQDESVIVYFTVGGNLFSAYGVSRGDEGELNCKLGVITFPKRNITLKYSSSTFVKVDLPIADGSLPTSKIDATLHTAVFGGTAYTLGDLEDMIDDNESDDALILYFDVGQGSLKSITHNAAFGVYLSYNGMLAMDNGYFFTIEDGVLTQKTLIYGSALVDGSITKDKLSAELKAELGLT